MAREHIPMSQALKLSLSALKGADAWTGPCQCGGLCDTC